MLVVGDAEVDEVDLGIGQQLGDVGIPGMAREVHLRPARPKLPWMPVQSPASFLGSRLQRAVTRPPVSSRAAR